MNTFFRKLTVAATVAVITVAFSCKKDSPTPTPTTTTTTTPTGEGYTSMSDFFAKNGVAAQTYTITGSSGGSFRSPQGTVVTIPPNAFLNSSLQVVTGPVTITFKDIYKKSDMLLSNIAATTTTGAPLKSGGEFYIKPTSGGNALTLANAITVTQPLDTLSAPDSAMNVYYRDTAGWALANLNASIVANASGYLTTLYTLTTPPTAGTWCNSDDPSYFSAYTQGTLVLQETDNATDYGTNVYLVFKGINTTDACHTGFGNNFNFTNCVPVGLQCTAVALGVKNGTLYSAIIPLTITSSQTISFSLTATTTAAFKAALEALN